ncbi:MAG: hypothetical protein HWE35_18315 [Rhodobacteraceae bacterium]|nr:hypothetical protein [Paracoccaceae bacterium]
MIELKSFIHSAEQQTRKALADYRDALTEASCKKFSHRAGVLFGLKLALDREKRLTVARDAAASVINRSPVHQEWMLQILDEQPMKAREKDRILGLLKTIPEGLSFR